MAKKYIMVQLQNKKYKLYSEDIKMVFMKNLRKIPKMPQFAFSFKAEDEDTDESNENQEEIKTPEFQP